MKNIHEKFDLKLWLWRLLFSLSFTTTMVCMIYYPEMAIPLAVFTLIVLLGR